jgi:hypothetical protein
VLVRRKGRDNNLVQWLLLPCFRGLVAFAIGQPTIAPKNVIEYACPQPTERVCHVQSSG